MDFSEWLKPDDAMEKLAVGVFGPAATIVAIFVLANLVWSWFGFSRPGGRGSVAAAYRRPAVAAVGTVVLILLQVVWVWSASRIANGLSYLWNAPLGAGSPDLGGLTSYARWDWISTLYMLVSIAALIASYVSAFGSDERDIVGGSTVVLALPLMLPWGLFCLVGSLFALVLAGIRTLTHDSPKLTDDGRTFLVVTLVVLSYTVALNLALGTTQIIARYWRSRVPENAW